MKKNLKSCIEAQSFDVPVCILDMNDYEMIQKSGLTPDLKHKKNAHITARWEMGTSPRVAIALGDPDLSHYRYLTFSVFAINGAGGSFRIRFANSADATGDGGYLQTLPICRNGWNDYRLELPFLQSVGAVSGWDRIRAIELDSVSGGQANRDDTVLLLDNLYGWETTAPQIYVKMPELKGGAMFSKTAAYAVVDRKRLPIAPDADPDARPFEESGILWLPVAPIAAVIGHRAVVDNKANTLNFTYRRKQYAFTGSTDIYTVNGETQKLPFKPVVRAGTIFFPSGYLCEFFHWRQMFVDPTGLIVLSNRKNAFESGRDDPIIRALNDEITFVQPTGEEILEDLHRKIPNPDKGRLLLLPEEWMVQRRLAKSDPTLGTLLNNLKASYGKTSSAYADAPLFADADVLDESADGRIQTAVDRMQGFSALFRLTGEKHYAERAAVECEAMARLSGWGAENSILRAATIGFAVTLAYDWCHGVWSEGRKALIERALLRYLMRPVVECYNGRLTMWRVGSPASAEINCAATASALALANVYPETSLKILRHSLRNASVCLDAYAPDGGYPEGVAAWERATRALVLLIAILQSATGKDYGLSLASGFAQTARFAVFTETSNGAWNFHGSAAKAVNTAVFGWFTRRYGSTLYAWIRRRDLLSGKKETNVLDLIFYTPIAVETPPTLPVDAVYRRAGLAILRSGWKAENVFLALHGGSNHEAGGELDAGSFSLEMGGERFFVETGDYHGLSRLFCARAEGQNTLVINPTDEHIPDQNPEAVAVLTEARSMASRAYAIVDMSSTNDRILRGKRGILLTDDRNIAVVQDELTLSSSAIALWSAYTPASVIYASARTLVLELNGKRLLCKLCGVGSGRFRCESVENTSLTRISVRVDVSEKLRMAVAFRLFSDGDVRSDKLYDIIPMSRWSE